MNDRIQLLRPQYDIDEELTKKQAAIDAKAGALSVIPFQETSSNLAHKTSSPKTFMCAFVMPNICGTR